jgi:hypothetical protein
LHGPGVVAFAHHRHDHAEVRPGGLERPRPHVGIQLAQVLVHGVGERRRDRVELVAERLDDPFDLAAAAEGRRGDPGPGSHPTNLDPLCHGHK